MNQDRYEKALLRAHAGMTGPDVAAIVLAMAWKVQQLEELVQKLERKLASVVVQVEPD
jgi:hypothetical protein